MVHDVAFDSDGTRLAAASEDGTVFLWEIPVELAIGNENLEVGVPLPLWNESPVYGVVFSSDGRFLATGDQAGKVRLWKLAEIPGLKKLACLLSTRNLTYKEWGSYFGVDKLYEETCEMLPVHPSIIAEAIALSREYLRQDHTDDAKSFSRDSISLIKRIPHFKTCLKQMCCCC
jgi:hypothetical protein